MTTGDISLHIRELGFDIGPFRLLEGFEANVSSGGALVLRGANGVGKTTVLKMIAGLLEPSAGDVFVRRGAEEDDVAPHAHYLGHKNSLKESQTVAQNLAFCRRFHADAGVSPEAAASQMGISRLLHLHVAALSAGQKRRAAFARLLVARRPIWLLDEPTAALDDASSVRVEDIVNAHLRDGGIAVVSTHLPFLTGLGEDRVEVVDLAQWSGRRDVIAGADL